MGLWVRLGLPIVAFAVTVLLAANHAAMPWEVQALIAAAGGVSVLAVIYQAARISAFLAQFPTALKDAIHAAQVPD